MSAPHYFAFAGLLWALCCCAPITPPEPDPLPEPIPVQTGVYWIRELDDQGRLLREWEVTKFKYTMFPKVVEFLDDQGDVVRLAKSFQIVQKP